jgi:hypothetical protein
MPIVKRQGPGKLIVTVPAGGAPADYIWIEESQQRIRSREQFRVLTLPTVAAVSPLAGPVGTQVTLTGQNFTGNTKVYFGQLAATIVKRNGPNELVIAIPTGARGKSPFTVEDQGERITTSQVFEVFETANPPPPSGDDASHHEHAHNHPHPVGDHHHHPHAHPHKPGATHHHPY